MTKRQADGHGFQGVVPDLVQLGDHALDRRQDQPADPDADLWTMSQKP